MAKDLHAKTRLLHAEPADIREVTMSIPGFHAVIGNFDQEAIGGLAALFIEGGQNALRRAMDCGTTGSSLSRHLTPRPVALAWDIDLR